VFLFCLLFLVPVQANVSLTRTVYPIGSDISIPCDVDGYTIPQVVWYKDEQLLEPSERIHVTGEYGVILYVTREIKICFVTIFVVLL
jgi:hypothetical protein